MPQPTEAQKLIMERMNYHPETCKAIAARLPPNISRQNVSMQCRIMADNDLIKRHGRGKFSLKRDQEPITFKAILRSDTDYTEPTPEPKKLMKKERETTSLDAFAQQFPEHYSWLIFASSRANSFAQSLLSQLRSGWMLTSKQLACIKTNPTH